MSNLHQDGQKRTALYSLQTDQVTSENTMSLPSSPHDYRGQSSERSGLSKYGVNELQSTWNKVLEATMFDNKPLLPYEGWNIDFSEITVGTRVGIGKYCINSHCYWHCVISDLHCAIQYDLYGK